MEFELKTERRISRWVFIDFDAKFFLNTMWYTRKHDGFQFLLNIKTTWAALKNPILKATLQTSYLSVRCGSQLSGVSIYQRSPDDFTVQPRLKATGLKRKTPGLQSQLPIDSWWDPKVGSSPPQAQFLICKMTQCCSSKIILNFTNHPLRAQELETHMKPNWIPNYFDLREQK